MKIATAFFSALFLASSILVVVADAGGRLVSHPVTGELVRIGETHRYRYNWRSDKWEHASDRAENRYNWHEGEWSYQEPAAEIKYNPYEQKYEFVKPFIRK